MGKVINDHVKMTSANGKTKPVPCWLIKQWEDQGILEDVAYNFTGPEDRENYAEWKASEKKRKARAKAKSGVITQADEGIAGAHLNLTPGDGAFVPHEPEALHGGTDQPPTGDGSDAGAGSEPDAGTSPVMDPGEAI